MQRLLKSTGTGGGGFGYGKLVSLMTELSGSVLQRDAQGNIRLSDGCPSLLLSNLLLRYSASGTNNQQLHTLTIVLAGYNTETNMNIISVKCKRE